MVGSGLSRQLVVVLLTMQLVVDHVDACYFRNCPIGGKRRSVNDALMLWINRLRKHDVSILSSPIHTARRVGVGPCEQDSDYFECDRRDSRRLSPIQFTPPLRQT